MKTRLGFVGNSSSSSFTTIGDSGDVDALDITDGMYVVGEKGETVFGWDPHTYTDIHSRVNFCYIQALEKQAVDEAVGQEWLSMLAEILQTYGHLHIDSERLEKAFETFSASIDHQSSAISEENIDMFEHKNALRAFIFDSGSTIDTDNDNH